MEEGRGESRWVCIVQGNPGLPSERAAAGKESEADEGLNHGTTMRAWDEAATRSLYGRWVGTGTSVSIG